MELRGVTIDELTAIVETVSTSNYGGNLKCEAQASTRARATGVRFTLRVHSSRGPGAHFSAPSIGNEKGRRTIAACWHVHRDVFEALFSRFPSAKISSAMARYEGVADFRFSFAPTYYQNAGSMMRPHNYGALCHCVAVSDACQHCSRHIIKLDDVWIDPRATGDDEVWRETCDSHDSFVADHEPMVENPAGPRDVVRPFCGTFREWEYDIQGNYGQGWETVTCEPTMAAAREQVRTYRENEPNAFRIRKVKVSA